MPESMPQGLITNILTPFYSKGKLDVEGLRKLLGRAKNNSVLINSSPEGILLHNAIRNEVIIETMKIISGDAKIIVGITGNTAAQTIDNVRMVENCIRQLKYTGQVLLFDCPLWYHSNRGLPAYYEEFSKAISLPIILSNNPGLILNLRKTLKRHNIRTNVFKRLAHNRKISGIEHSGELHRFLNYARAGKTRPDFVFYDGDEMNFLNNPGVSGVISIGANILPEYWGEIVKSSLQPDDFRKDDANHCRLLWQKREKIKQLYLCYKANPIAIVKAALKHMGIINSDTVAERLEQAKSEEKNKIYRLLQEIVNEKDPLHCP